jgi:hypothetical protein
MPGDLAAMLPGLHGHLINWCQLSLVPWFIDIFDFLIPCHTEISVPTNLGSREPRALG